MKALIQTIMPLLNAACYFTLEIRGGVSSDMMLQEGLRNYGR